MTILEYCIEQARKIHYVHGRYRLYSAVLDRKGRVIGESSNLYNRSHPQQKYYSTKAGLNENKIFLHAELAAMLKVRSGKPNKIVVARVDKYGHPVNACPCLSCQLAIKEFQIGSVEFTT